MEVVLRIPLAQRWPEPVAHTEKGWVDSAGGHHHGEEFIDVLKHKNVLVLRLSRPRLPGTTAHHEDHDCRHADGKAP